MIPPLQLQNVYYAQWIGQKLFLFGNSTGIHMCFHATHWLSDVEWCVYAPVNYTVINSDNGFSPERHKTIIWTHSGVIYIEHMETNFSKICFKMQNFREKMKSSAPRKPFCFSLDILNCMTSKLKKIYYERPLVFMCVLWLWQPGDYCLAGGHLSF